MSQFPARTTTPAVNASFKHISTQKLTASAGAVTFSGISSTYKALFVQAYIDVTTNGSGAGMSFNNDGTNAYALQTLRGQGTVTNGNQTGQSAMNATLGVGIKNDPAAFMIAWIFKMAAAKNALLFNQAEAMDNFDSNLANGFAGNLWVNASDINRFDLMSTTYAADTTVRLEGFAP